MSAKTALDVLVDFAPGDDTSPITKEARAELAALREAAEALKFFTAVATFPERDGVHCDYCSATESERHKTDCAYLRAAERASAALAASGVVGGKPRPCPYCGETRNGAHKSWCQFLHQFDHGLDDAAQETK